MPRRIALLTVAALTAGILGDLLLRETPWGINLFLWLTPFVALSLWLTRPRPGLALLATGVAALFFAWCVAWRDAPVLTAWNVMAVLGLGGLAALQSGGHLLHRTALGGYVRGVCTALVLTLLGPVSLMSRLAPPQAAPSGNVRMLRGTLIGLALAVPILAVFGSLLVAADPAFERLVRSFMDWNFEVLFSHVALAGAMAWLVSGYWSSLLGPSDAGRTIRFELPHPTLGALEFGIPLGTLTLLFACFVVVQIRYLFGGEALIRELVGLSYAEYARRGFFELIAVSVLVLPMLIAADWLRVQDDRRSTRAFRTIAAVQLLLVGVILLSAGERLRLYQAAYGLTQARLYAAGVMVWITMTLSWFAATGLRGRRERFSFGAIVAAAGVLATLNIANPDGIVVRTNTARAGDPSSLDFAYLEELSADAVPALRQAVGRLAPEAGCVIREQLVRRWHRAGGADWRTWNLGRWHAGWVVYRLERAEDPCPARESAPAQPEG